MNPRTQDVLSAAYSERIKMRCLAALEAKPCSSKCESCVSIPKDTYFGEIIVCLPSRSALQHRRHPLKQPATDLTCTGRPWEWQANDVPSIVLRLSLQQEPLPRHEPLNCVYQHLLSGVSGGEIRHHPSHLHLPRESEWEQKRAKGLYDVTIQNNTAQQHSVPLPPPVSRRHAW